MATEGGGKEMNEIKTQFTTREGLYKLLPNSEYSRPNRVPFNSQGSNPVRVSFVNLNDQSGNGDRLCFNVGRELYFYIYKGVRKAADLSKPIDKRIYKGTQPTCHDFNHLTATAESVSLLVGFSAGQVQLIDPIKKETSKLFNEESSCQHLWKVDWNEERENEGSKTSEEALVTVQTHSHSIQMPVPSPPSLASDLFSSVQFTEASAGCAQAVPVTLETWLWTRALWRKEVPGPFRSAGLRSLGP
ncbi:WD repeat-containing protein 20 isoform X6 [Pipistrellus kuhlii]|uniref:WD repeat-containing protein 20 isoform X6 n=1 Tax=Pipistrellus kuhlii TaxID=59472 RepID=UPI001E26F44A|nr:WD repeat-containing protein 20 isoform X6 [Pipistrellus kuhlii]